MESIMASIFGRRWWIWGTSWEIPRPLRASIKHLGPCLGTNGHSGRDPDTISRLPDTTSHFLSVFIGFRCSNRVKIVILVENMNLYRKTFKIKIVFCSGDHSRPFWQSKIFFWVSKKWSKNQFFIYKSISRFKKNGTNLKTPGKNRRNRPTTQIYRGFLLKPEDSGNKYNPNN